MVNAFKVMIMLDLKKIQKKFDHFFETETEESFNEWLREKKMRELFLSLGIGKGTIEELKDSIPTQTYPKFECPIKVFDFGNNQESFTTSDVNSQYAMAA